MEHIQEPVPVVLIDMAGFSKRNREIQIDHLKRLQQGIRESIQPMIGFADPDQVIRRHGTGDGYYLFLKGYPIPAAMRFVWNLEQFLHADKIRHPGEEPLRLRVGLTLGDVGLVGDQYLGDALILAQRLIDHDLIKEVLQKRPDHPLVLVASAPFWNLWYHHPKKSDINLAYPEDRPWIEETLVVKHGDAIPCRIQVEPELLPRTKDIIIQRNNNLKNGEYISGIELHNLKCLRQFSWKLEAGEEAPGWHVLLGDNGSGKSTFLQACAMGMLPVEDVLTAGINLDGWPSQQEEMAEIWIHCDSGRKLFTTIRRARENTFEREWFPSFIGFGAAYGPYRRFRGGTIKAADILKSDRPLARYLSVFGEDAAMVHVQSWLRDLHHAALEGKSAEKKMLADVTTFLNQEGLLPQEVQLVSVSSDQVVFEDPAGTRVDINSLSDGYRSILSMMLELIRQMGLFYRDQTIFSPNGHQVIMPGVVLLDEIDAHLHPRWQRVIGPWLTRCFPKVQFLITTHSVLVCQGAIKGSVWLLPDPANPDDPGQRLTGSALDQLLYGNLLEAYHSNAFGPGIDRSDEARKKLEYFAHLNVKSMGGMLQPDEEREYRILQKIFGASSDAWEKP
ncbi:MAG: AAA family ATPase [Magnetococcales bacterium]|nr:AAA family ATPase [Magnetococcales bacterium]MBF0150331.1 AAA family ATPase [Magnetococcales bacterium]